MRMLCIMATAPKPGYLVTTSGLISDADLARMVPGVTETEVAGYVDELSRNGVFSTSAKGERYNRRMVREQKRSAINARNGKKGGDVSASNGKVFGSRSASGGSAERSGTRSPTISSLTAPPAQQREGVATKPADASERAQLAARVAGAIGVRQLGDLPPSLSGNLMATVEAWVADGYDWTTEISPTLATKPSGEAFPRSVKFWTSILGDKRKSRAAAQGMSGRVPSSLPIQDQRLRMKAFNTGKWPDHWGAKPGEPGCLISESVIGEFRQTAG